MDTLRYAITDKLLTENSSLHTHTHTHTHAHTPHTTHTTHTHTHTHHTTPQTTHHTHTHTHTHTFRHCAISRKVVVSIPDGVIKIFSLT